MVAAPRAHASEMDKKTFLTFHQPMEIPGMILPAGEYVIKRADRSLPDVIRVSDRSENHTFATVFTIPTYRERPTSKTVIITEERAANQPEAIKKWFYPGDTVGAEFIYPKSHGALLAMNTVPPAFSSESNTVSTEEHKMSEPVVEPARVEPEHVEEVEPAPAHQEIAQNTMPPSSSSSAPAEPAPAATTQTQLPQTGSNLSLVALFGLLCTAAGLGLKKLAQCIS
jgi:LPXTG-motif cell wall-anchored protein